MKIPPWRNSSLRGIRTAFQFVCLFIIGFNLVACNFQVPSWQNNASASTPLYIPPTLISSKVAPTSPSLPTEIENSVQFTLSPTATLPCSNNLTYLSDLTLPDGTQVEPNSSLDKRWQVKNSGTCNWDANYSLKNIGGNPLGITTDQELFPARAGSQVTLRLVFTAPADPGTYSSVWQASGPDGTAFGDSVYIEIVVK